MDLDSVNAITLQTCPQHVSSFNKSLVWLHFHDLQSKFFTQYLANDRQLWNTQQNNQEIHTNNPVCTWLIYWKHQTVDPGVCLVTPGLLQLTAVRHHWPTNVTGAVCTERGCTSGDWCSLKRPQCCVSCTGYLCGSASTSRSSGWSSSLDWPSPGLPMTATWRHIMTDVHFEN